MMDKVNNNVMPVIQTARPVEAPVVPKKAKGATDELSQADFISQLGQATVMSAPLSAAAPSAVPAPAQAIAQVKPGGSSKLGPQSSAEKSPSTQMSAASLNTAASIAGLKPWSKEWVFEGRPEISQEQAKPQIDLATLAALEKQLSSEMRGDAAAVKAFDEKPRTRASAVPEQVAGSGVWMQKLNPQSDPNLSMEVVSLDAVPKDKASEKASPEKGLHIAGLSGEEFVNTLGATQGGKGESSLSGDDNSRRGDSSLSYESPQIDQVVARPAKDNPLRVIEGGRRANTKDFGDNLMSAIPVPHSAGTAERAVPLPINVTGHVVSGSMARDRLSSESLLGISNGVKNLSFQGGGEIRVRLKPENLGELNLKVVAHGNQVGLHIQASDERAKKILEESISHLKESLAGQSLNLNKVDLSVAAPAQNTAMGNDMRDDSGRNQNGGPAYQEWMNQNPSQSNQNRSNPWASSDRETMTMGPNIARVAPSAVNKNQSDSSIYRSEGNGNWRLDTRA